MTTNGGEGNGFIRMRHGEAEIRGIGTEERGQNTPTQSCRRRDTSYKYAAWRKQPSVLIYKDLVGSSTLLMPEMSWRFIRSC